MQWFIKFLLAIVILLLLLLGGKGRTLWGDVVSRLVSSQQMSQAPANARLESMVNQKSADFSQRMNTYFKKTNTYFIRFFLFKPTNHNLQSMTVKKVWNTKYLTLMRADSGRAVMRARSRRAYARRFAGAHAFLATCAQIMGALQATNPPTTTYRVWLWRNSGAQSILHWCAQIRGALSCAQGHGAHMRVDCWRACILGHLHANHGRAASYKPTSHNLQSMTVKKLWNTKYLTLMRADSGRTVMRARSRRAYARRLLARMHFSPPARKSRARCKLQTHQPQLTEYDCEETLEISGTQSILYTHARRFGARCHARKVTARICA